MSGSRNSGRRWVAVGCLGLGLAGAGGLVLLVRQIYAPPALRCTLPVVAGRGTCCAWSRDSQRLLMAGRDGEVSVLHFPYRHVELLAPLEGRISQAVWDAHDDPVVIAARPAMRAWRWGSGRGHWEDAAQGADGLSISPDGEWLVSSRDGIRLPRGMFWRSIRLRHLVGGESETRVDPDALRAIAERRSGTGRLQTGPVWWAGPDQLCGSLYTEDGTALPGYWTYNVPEARLQWHSGLPTAYFAPGRVACQWRSADWAEARAMLRRLHVPGLPGREPDYLWTVLRDNHGRVARQAVLGEGMRETWSARVTASPDGHRAVVSDVEGTLRLLEVD